MGRTYAGVLGTLAMVTVVARGLMHGGGVEVTIKSALLGMLLFAVLGWVVGSLAEQAIDEAARRRLKSELHEVTGGAETAREGGPGHSENG